MIINNVVHGGPCLKIPAHLSFGQYVIDKLREHSQEDRIALINGDSGHKTTYKELLQNVVNVATGLKLLGVKRGDVVALCSENRIEFIVSSMAAICCGATVTTLNPIYSKDELTHVLNISRPNILLCSQTPLRTHLATFKSLSFIKKIIQFDGTVLSSDIISYESIQVSANAFEYEAEEVQGWTDNVYILYSSGTTGLPKGVMLTHINALYAAANFENKTTYDEAYSRFLTIVPWYHAYGLMTTINYFTVRKTLVFFAGFIPDKYFGAIQQYKINVLLMVPPMVVFLAKSPVAARYDLSSVTVAWCGAAPLTRETIEAALKRMPNCTGIFQAYGMTETSTAATKDPDDEDATRKIGSGGMPLPGVKAKIVDLETRQKLGPNHNGEICLKGPVVMKGYAGNEAATRDVFDKEGYIKTGDIGYYDQDGYFFIVDRLKELIKYKGNQVAPAAVESVVLQHKDVAECGVVGRADEVAGELPTAFIVLRPGATVKEQDIKDFVASRLSPEHHLRGGIIFVNDIPKNPSGKILRRALKQRLQDKPKSKL
ncbi:luciferin 4-monooxygenase-like [Epargyreus clarus]|uniref:luciferin 4-monooxygenase-like n=1 Tax=Epargyreus clarus TaxID=520877 RepID=UPI003C2E0DA5